MTGRDISESFIIHQPHEDFFVAIHSLNKQIFQMLVEYRFEVLNRVGHYRLTQLFIGHGRLANLIKKQLVSRRKFRAKPLIEFAHQGRKLHFLISLPAANIGRTVKRFRLANFKINRPFAYFL